MKFLNFAKIFPTTLFVDICYTAVFLSEGYTGSCAISWDSSSLKNHEAQECSVENLLSNYLTISKLLRNHLPRSGKPMQ